MVQSNYTIEIVRVVGSTHCVSSRDGVNIYGRLASILNTGRVVNLSFKGVETLSDIFLHAAIGQLYAKFSGEEIRSMVKVVDITPTDRALLIRVVKTAKKYFE